MSTSTRARITLPMEAIAALGERWHITRLSLFGSVLRDDFRPDSDIDVLVEFDPEHVPGYEFITIQDELSALLQGRVVDLIHRPFLNRHIRAHVLADEEVLYAA